jgi:hypothetical protein
MRLRNDYPEGFVKYCRVKFNNIQNRVRNRKSYVERGIRNEFVFEFFVEFAWNLGLVEGLHCHRPNRNGNYSPSNLVFVTAEEHRQITAKERRKLTDDQVYDIREMRGKKSLRKIAKQFDVSHTAIFFLLQGKSYRC